MLNGDELSKLRTAGRVAAAARDIGLDMVRPGAKLYDIAQETESYIRSHGCGLAFPCNVSVNEVAAHYTPSVNDKKTIAAGDVVKVDCGAHLDGWVGDTAGTAEAGTSVYSRLIRASMDARDAISEFIGNGTSLSEIGRAAEMTMKAVGYVPVRNLCGHQIDRYNLHAGMSVPNYDSGDGTKLDAGMVVAVEPFATNGAGEVVNGRPGNIVRILREREIEDSDTKEFFEYVKGEFGPFPFCARSCDFPNAEKHVSRLIRRGVLSSYAQLVEVKKGIVTQHEHTFYISEGRAEITTLP